MQKEKKTVKNEKIIRIDKKTKQRMLLKQGGKKAKPILNEKQTGEERKELQSPNAEASEKVVKAVRNSAVISAGMTYKAVKKIRAKEYSTDAKRDKETVLLDVYHSLQREYEVKAIQDKKEHKYRNINDMKRVEHRNPSKPVVLNITEKRKQEIKQNNIAISVRDKTGQNANSEIRVQLMNPHAKQVHYTMRPSAARTMPRYQEVQKNILQKKLQHNMVQNTVNQNRKKYFTALQYAKEFGMTTMRTVTSTAGNIFSLLAIMTVLVCIVFFAMLSAVAASPFGILFSNEAAESGTMTVSAASAAVNHTFTEKLEALQNADSYANVYIEGNPANMTEVLSVFAVKTAGNEMASSADVISIDQKKLEELKQVYWDMTDIMSWVESRVIVIDEDTSYTERDLHIKISAKTAVEQSISYRFTKRQNDALRELLSQKILLSGLLKSVGAMSVEANEVLHNLPENISADRKAVVKEALSLVGKVNYFWGGKSLALGWNDKWGELRRVTAEGSPTTGTYRLYGLDCSGFIDWAFFNASNGKYVLSDGGGVAAQRANCVEIAWSDAQVGDLVFYDDNSHAGIICGKTETGELLIVHCASGDMNNVVITDKSGFERVGRPIYFNE